MLAKSLGEGVRVRVAKVSDGVEGFSSRAPRGSSVAAVTPATSASGVRAGRGCLGASVEALGVSTTKIWQLLRERRGRCSGIAAVDEGGGDVHQCAGNVITRGATVGESMECKS